MAKGLITESELKQLETIAREFGGKTSADISSQISRLGLKDKGDLIRSIKYGLKKNLGVVEGITFSYNYYGLFHDVGADNAFGKGVRLPARNWRANAINPNAEKLADQLANKYGDIAIKNILFEKTK
jgi:phage gpG-like protein